MTAESKELTTINKKLQQKNLTSNVFRYIQELQNQNLTLENFPQEFLKFLKETLHDKAKKDAFLNFLNSTLPNTFSKKSLKDTKRKSIITVDNPLEENKTEEIESSSRLLTSLAEKLQKAIDNTIRKKPKRQALIQLKEAFIQEIINKLRSLECPEDELEGLISGIREPLETLINAYNEKKTEQNSAHALKTAKLYLGETSSVTPSPSPSSISINDGGPSANSVSPAPSIAPEAEEVKTAPQRNNHLVKAINNLTGAICQKKEITNPKMMEDERVQLEEMCKTGLLGKVEIITTRDFHKCFQDLIKAVARKKNAGDTKAIKEIKVSFKKLCKLIGIDEESSPGQAAAAIECLYGEGGRFQYSGLSIRAYGKTGSSLINIAEYLKDVLPGELGLEKEAGEELDEISPLSYSYTEILLARKPRVSENKVEAPQPLNLGKTINALTGEICQLKEITRLGDIQTTRDLLVTGCAEHEVVEEITQKNLLEGFNNLVIEISKTKCDKTGIERRKAALQAFCNILCIPPDSSPETAANRIHALFDQGGEFEFSTLPTLEMRILGNEPKKLETLLRDELPIALIEKTPEEIAALEEAQRRMMEDNSIQLAPPAKHEGAPPGNKEEKSRAPSKPVPQNPGCSFDSFFELIHSANEHAKKSSPPGSSSTGVSVTNGK